MENKKQVPVSPNVVRQMTSNNFLQDEEYLLIEEDDSVYEFDMKCLNQKIEKKKAE